MIRIMYEDSALVVCEKPVGVLSAPESGKRRDMPALLKKQTGAYRIDVIHRLDQPVGGVMVYSKSDRATPGLYRQMAGHRFTKEYLAVVCGRPFPQPEGQLQDWLLKDRKHCFSRTVPPGTPDAKPASLRYRFLDTVEAPEGPLSLVKVGLDTGRTHQIRVQLSSRKCPILGDGKYGGRAVLAMKGLGLWSYRLAFNHPTQRTLLDEVCPPPREYPWTLFDKGLFSLPVPPKGERPVSSEAEKTGKAKNSQTAFWGKAPKSRMGKSRGKSWKSWK